MHTFVDNKIKDAQVKIASIKTVGLRSPRAAHRLLSCCASKLLSFLSTTVPPHIMFEKLRAFDNMLEYAFFEILCPTLIECSDERMARARLKLRLQSPVGCGLFRTADQGSFAWWSSVSCCLSDVLL